MELVSRTTECFSNIYLSSVSVLIKSGTELTNHWDDVDLVNKLLLWVFGLLRGKIFKP